MRSPVARASLVAVALLTGLPSCQVDSPPAGETVVPKDDTSPHHDLDAILWVQRAAEYRAAALQAFRAARGSLEVALATPEWSAVPDPDPGFRELPPAIIVDVDETVLDNSPFEAWLAAADRGYSPGAWGRWANEAAAEPVPGALEFCKHAAGRGVAVFYVTNRPRELHDATCANLRSAGFPVDEACSRIMTREESREKEPRRRAVSKSHRVLLLVGDDLNDFASVGTAGADERVALAGREPARSYWGTRWIVLPNPIYGGWKRSLVPSGTPPEDVPRRKRESLRPWTPAQVPGGPS